jgi:hypothetical protein
MTATPNHALQRTAAVVTACASDHANRLTTDPLTAPSAQRPTLAAFARTGCAALRRR